MSNSKDDGKLPYRHIRGDEHNSEKEQKSKEGIKESDLLREPSAAYGRRIYKDGMKDPVDEAYASDVGIMGTEAADHSRKYTIDDYYALPDDKRFELIDGIFYDMSAPTQIHQALLGQLYIQFSACIESHPECELFFAPLDVRLDNDDYTMVQPDLLIVCNRSDKDKRRINGAPDFVVEILSPFNRSHDMIRKLGKYKDAGVREYWIIDPEKGKVIVYDLEHDDFLRLYTFRDSIPVLISDGECSIEFERIYEKVKRYF